EPVVTRIVLPRTVAAAVLVVRPGHDPWPLEPTGEAPRDLGHVLLLTRRQLAEELGLAAVALIEGHLLEADAVAHRPVEEFQSDLPLGSVHHGVGDAGLATAIAVGGPALGQEQFAVEQAMKVATRQSEVHGDHAVLGLAEPAAPLLLNPGRLVPLL